MMLIKALQRILNDLQMFLHAGFWSLIRLLQPKNDKQSILRDKKRREGGEAMDTIIQLLITIP